MVKGKRLQFTYSYIRIPDSAYVCGLLMSTANIYTYMSIYWNRFGAHGSLTHRRSVPIVSRDGHFGGDFYGNTFSAISDICCIVTAARSAIKQKPNKPHQVHFWRTLTFISMWLSIFIVIFATVLRLKCWWQFERFFLETSIKSVCECVYHEISSYILP